MMYVYDEWSSSLLHNQTQMLDLKRLITKFPFPFLLQPHPLTFMLIFTLYMVKRGMSRLLQPLLQLLIWQDKKNFEHTFTHTHTYTFLLITRIHPHTHTPTHTHFTFKDSYMASFISPITPPYLLCWLHHKLLVSLSISWPSLSHALNDTVLITKNDDGNYIIPNNNVWRTGRRS